MYEFTILYSIVLSRKEQYFKKKLSGHYRHSKANGKRQKLTIDAGRVRVIAELDMAVRVRTIVRQCVGDDLPEVTERQEEQYACTLGLHPCSKTSQSSPYFISVSFYTCTCKVCA